MTLEILIALIVFSFASSVTPGPNNLMLLASGVNFGFRRTVPHMLGVALGFAFLLLCVGLGIGQLLLAAPVLFTAVKIAGVAYLLYLAWKIAMAGPPKEGVSRGAPMTFLQAALFQWVNPKAWMMAVTAMALYTDAQHYFASVALIVLIFTVINLPSVSLWCGMGMGLRRFLANGRILRIFNVTMAGLLVLSLWPMLA